MKVLILSCNTGGGHNAAGRAMVERIRYEGHEAKLLDIMSLAGERTSRLVGDVYIKTAKYTPKLFQAAYKAGDLISSSRHKSPVYLANSRMAGHLWRYLQEHETDILVMPHLFPAETVTYMKKHGMLEIPAIAVSTDYTCIPFWEETNCDAYVIPHPDLTAEYRDKGIPEEKLYPLGIPTSMELAPKLEQKEARRQLRLPEDTPLYLIIGGSMGFGKLRELTEALVHSGQEHDIAVICGSDRKMQEELTREFAGMARVHILGFISEISKWLDACSIVYTKPGGLTSTEALVKQVPIIHTAPIPGCETKNAEFFSSRGMSLAEKSVKMQVEKGKELLYDFAMQDRMKAAQQKNSFPQASLNIFRLMQKLCEAG
ncbi:MAG: glycosyltransferase [Lachnospiraceae bacterium]|nr:glycosyltransferase [Lachnospiraceae bacterium]